MKTKILFFTLCIIVLSGCSGNMEYAYNEKVSSNVLSVKEIYEKMDKDMQEGSIGKKEPRNLKNIIVKRLENMDELEPGDAAKEFHGKANEYLKFIENDAVNTFEAYLALDCDCPEKKDSIKVIANGIYNKSTDILDEMLDVQLKYMDKVGLKPAN